MRYSTTIFVLGLGLAGIVSTHAIEPQYAERIADAIYRAEGGSAAKVPYGILSVRVQNEQEARKVCLNTIRNNWQRWSDAGQPGHFIDFLGNRYCPPSADPVGNRNWRRNVKFFLTKDSPSSTALERGQTAVSSAGRPAPSTSVGPNQPATVASVTR